MTFEEALKALKKGKRVWHTQWNKTYFLMRDEWNAGIFHLTIWNSLLKTPSPSFSFKGSDERLYSIIGSFRMDKDDNESVLKSTKLIMVEYFCKAQHALGMIGYKLEERDIGDDWEIVND
jgi:hypothetical protein